ncbi:PAS domain-containing sensor histidine kinase [Methanobacterium sp.]|uniref:PAS domain-containing sensor histidine kinase n=1 Tax=Methanobacterium sp. TaxID=2164 RepID=UPI003D65BC37
MMDDNGKFKESFEKSPIGILFFDKEGNLTDANQSALKIGGIPSLNDVIGLNLFDDVDIAPIKDKLCEKDPINIQAPFDFDYFKKLGIYNPTRSGTAWVDLIISVIDSGFLVQIQDITEHKKYQESLKESEEKFRVIADESPVSITVYRGNRHLYVNPAAESLLGYTKKELLKMSYKEFIHPDYQSMIEEMAKARMRGEVKTKHYEVKIITKDGQEKWTETSSNLVKYEDSPAVVIISVDITERKKIEQELKKAHDTLEEQVEKRTKELKEAYNSLKESESKFKTLAESSPDIINRIDKEFKTVYINPAIIEISDKTPEHFIGKNIDKLGIPEEFTVPLKEKTIKAFNTREILEFETEMPTVKGLKTFYTYLTPEFDENGEVNTVFTVSHDITELKQAENHLKEIIQELERSNAELQSFAYITSHDLQEPLRTIASFAQLLQRRYKGQLDSNADEFIDYMVNGSIRMKDMIQGLLDYSRVGTQGGEYSEFNSEVAVSNALSNLRSAIEECHAEVTYNNLPTIIADKDQITRVFQNLLGNALKFRKKGIKPEIHISAQKTDNEYVFSVNDNGIGLEEQYSVKIFEVFKRLHSIGEYQGGGIGLAIVKRIIETHGGRIWLESSLGKGSTFYFTIPFKNE